MLKASTLLPKEGSARERLETTKSRAAELLDSVRNLSTHDALVRLIEDEFKGRVALVSSFGTESAILLHLVAQVNPNTPVIFMDTGKLFGETHRYRRQLTEFLGLTDVRQILPEEAKVSEKDPKGILWNQDTDMCCWVRKVEPMNRALDDLDAWISGRKRFQSVTRAKLELVEAEGSRIKINPLAYWERDEITAYFNKYNLPRHPLEADGYPSVGCMPCTDRVEPGEDPRSGRWKNQDKTECGIHFLDTGAARNKTA
ncbi:phosphoadenosine phosphosulfate reductase [Kiloniella litopenaei]|uniref:Adenosine 5'-phosphosulfate reductase n=1 Tax=Kiloniella litopenaei TaxID=1549748 RepID=A0A0M2R6C6_9PROT|nr:phosphoadenylyl-sulfate reductase [Kiloniella litopenaei]KKJ77447.1 phosphoadenosine phosphosulfate reductase [Kiloniella litopenaei]